ncbi:hypothetical protein FVF58_50645 [Paraburkholderia panacisoli]|uniref:Uncharacterized protein n=1 Tax=Paraburkholderia panacisoli TaxID=2603818 RepID=A0A5B0FYF6_9BURK|nr:hypothetical protein [Paraburkholderia panacisoli]KAA0996092.1 hypothetical protein FVF58_50645 [Paraburkholderia panacisoli]
MPAPQRLLSEDNETRSIDVSLAVPGAKPVSTPAQKPADLSQQYANPLATSKKKAIRHAMPDERTGICLVGHNLSVGWNVRWAFRLMNVDGGPERLSSCRPYLATVRKRKEPAASRTRYDCAHVVPVTPFRCMSYLRKEEIMKRDMNLALAILKTLEENKSPHLSEFDIESALKEAFDVSNRGI